MTTHDRALLRAVLRQDFCAFVESCFRTVVPGQTFVPNWHVEAIAYRLDQVLRGEINRLLITIPPRHLKSICTSVAFPAFVLGHDPTRRCVCISYAHELAAKHARDCRAVMESDWYRSVFPRTRIDPRKNRETEFDTTARGFRFSTSVGGTLTGRGGNLLIIDDPLKPVDAMSETKRTAANEWYDSTLPSRLDDKNTDAIVIIMQRLHMDDLAGHLLTRESNWVHLDLPAIAESSQQVPISPTEVHFRESGALLHPEREPLSVLERLKAEMGSQAFSAQYQQAPVPPGGAIIKEHWFRRYRRVPMPEEYDMVVQSWDTASKPDKTNDYSVCLTWLVRNEDYFLLDVLRERLSYPNLRRRIISHARDWEAESVLIEDASSGIALIQDLLDERSVYPIAIKAESDKLVRLEAQCALIEAGHVRIPEDAPWLVDFLREVLGFPHAAFDDQVDSLSQFLAWVRRRRVDFAIAGF